MTDGDVRGDVSQEVVEALRVEAQRRSEGDSAPARAPRRPRATRGSASVVAGAVVDATADATADAASSPEAAAGPAPRKRTRRKPAGAAALDEAGTTAAGADDQPSGTQDAAVQPVRKPRVRKVAVARGAVDSPSPEASSSEEDLGSAGHEPSAPTGVAETSSEGVLASSEPGAPEDGQARRSAKLENLTLRNIRRMVGEGTLARGTALRDHVERLRWNLHTQAFKGTVVAGADSFTAELQVPRHGRLRGTCSCPVGRDCQHLAALGLAALNHPELVEAQRRGERERDQPRAVEWFEGLDDDERDQAVSELFKDPQVLAALSRIHAAHGPLTREALRQRVELAGRRGADDAERDRAVESVEEWAREHGNKEVVELWPLLTSWRKPNRDAVLPRVLPLVTPRQALGMLDKHWVPLELGEVDGDWASEFLDEAYAARASSKAGKEVVLEWARTHGNRAEVERLEALEADPPFEMHLHALHR